MHFQQHCYFNNTICGKQVTDLCYGNQCNCVYEEKAGLHCELQQSTCSLERCSSNGRCVNENNTVVCQCATGFAGMDCSICGEGYTNENDLKLKCINANAIGKDNKVCSGKGEYKRLGDGYCNCSAELTGEACQYTIAVCDKEMCNDNGKCLFNEVGGSYC